LLAARSRAFAAARKSAEPDWPGSSRERANRPEAQVRWRRALRVASFAAARANVLSPSRRAAALLKPVASIATHALSSDLRSTAWAANRFAQAASSSRTQPSSLRQSGGPHGIGRAAQQ
jgi:hypothetical protein